MGCFPSHRSPDPISHGFLPVRVKEQRTYFYPDTGAIRDILDAERPRAPSQMRLDPVTAAMVTQIFAWYTDVHAVWR